MPNIPATQKPRSPKKATPGPRSRASAPEVLARLERLGTKRDRDGMARYAIHTDKAFGVAMAKLLALGKELGRDHDLAEALWASGWYEARLLASFVAEPSRLTPAQMDRWCRDFDNWAVCDTVCFHLFDRTPHAFGKVAKWARLRGEFGKRAAFALLASVALHDKSAEDEPFTRCLPLIEAAATDERNFVKKSVSWALRSIGHRNVALHTSSVELARRLAASPDPTSRWIGKDALRHLGSAAVIRRLSKKKAAGSRR